MSLDRLHATLGLQVGQSEWKSRQATPNLLLSLLAQEEGKQVKRNLT